MKPKFTCDLAAAQAAMKDRYGRHDALANKIRYAILDAVCEDKSILIEERLALVNPVDFRVALADVVIELVGDSNVNAFIDELRIFSEEDPYMPL